MPRSRSAYRDFPHVSQLLEAKLFLRRKRMKISQTALAARTGLTRNCIQQLECHEHLPLHSTLFELMRGLEFTQEESRCFLEELQEAYHKDWVYQKEKEERRERREKRKKEH